MLPRQPMGCQHPGAVSKARESGRGRCRGRLPLNPGERRLEDAEAASRAGDWSSARTSYADLVASDPAPSGELLLGLARASNYSGAFAEGGQVLERAYRAFVEAGDHRGATTCCTALTGLRMMSDDRAAARAWERRGWRHLENVGPCLERGYHAVAVVGCDIHDPATLYRQATQALAVAREFDDHQLELRALAEQGLALVCQGQVDEGFALLDEVMVGLTAGEVTDPQMCGLTLCSLLTACDRTGDHGRAEQWGRLIETMPELHEMGIQVTHCQIAYGAVDTMRGRFESAEVRLQAAIDAHATTRYHRAVSRAKLAELRIYQGRVDEAAALLAGYEDEFETAQALAALSAAHGEFGRAAALLRSHIRGLGKDSMRLGPSLGLLVEMELHRDDIAAAERAARRLLGLEDECSSNEIRAMARLAAARISNHKGDAVAAVVELETALTLLVHRDCPLLTAQVRLELARALGASGDSPAAVVEAEAALTTFRRLGVVPGIAAGELVLSHVGSGAPQARRAGVGAPRLDAAESLTRREEEVARLVAQGLTNRQVADRLYLSVRTVETHVDRVLGKLDFHTRSQLAAWVQQGEPAAAT